MKAERSRSATALPVIRDDHEVRPGIQDNTILKKPRQTHASCGIVKL